MGCYAREGGTPHFLLPRYPALSSASRSLLLAFYIHLHALILGRVGADEATVPFHAFTHHGVGGPGAKLSLLFLRSLHAGLAPPTQFLASPLGQVHGLEGAEGWGGGFMISCWDKGGFWGFSGRSCFSLSFPPVPQAQSVSQTSLKRLFLTGTVMATG